jgi:hypothetical protein
VSRILDLPRRDWRQTSAELVPLLTQVLRTPNGRETLRPVQAVSLLEASECNGVCCFDEVGGGKTLVAALLPTVLAARRPILFAPGGMVSAEPSPIRLAHHHIRQHWQMVPMLRIESYDRLERGNHADLLERYRPDCIVCDEAHVLKNFRRSSAARRIRRYLEKHPECTFSALTATPSEHGAKDYLHIVLWALRRGAPVPLDYDQQAQVSLCLDPAVETRPDLQVMAPIVGQCSDYDDARRRFRDRLVSTSGVVINAESWGKPGSLLLREIRIDTTPPVEEAFEQLRRFNRLPDGWPLEDVRQTYGAARELGCGFYYQHDPWPPEPWREARKAWCSFVRDVVEEDLDRYDTAMQVAEACLRGALPRHCYDQWVAVRDGYNPEEHKVTTWLDDHVLRAAEQWGKVKPGLVWCEHIGFARELAQRTGWQYYTEGRNPEEADGRQTIILALKANREGKNLQYRWHRNLFVTVPSTVFDWEQAVGRTHRMGQRSDVVTVDYFSTCLESQLAFWTALARAENMLESRGTRSKILLADRIQSGPGSGSAWVRKEIAYCD